MRRQLIWLVPAALAACHVLVFLLSGEFTVPENFPVLTPEEIGAESNPPTGEATATFGSGCFWCTEAVFQQMKGVRHVASGYSGGTVKDPTYAMICTGRTGHAEVVRVTFDPAVISYPELLEVFWRSHDPTTLNRQGNDVGTQYRSVIFHHTQRQRELAERYKRKIDEAGVFRSPVVTEIVPAVEFYPAESDHQNYFADNGGQPYCRVVIGPKIEKLRKVFQDKLR